MNKADNRTEIIDTLLKEGFTPAQIGAMADSRRKDLEKKQRDEETKRIKKEQAKQQIIAGVGAYLKAINANRTEIEWNDLFDFIEMKGEISADMAKTVDKITDAMIEGLCGGWMFGGK